MIEGGKKAATYDLARSHIYITASNWIVIMDNAKSNKKEGPLSIKHTQRAFGFNLCSVGGHASTFFFSLGSRKKMFLQWFRKSHMNQQWKTTVMLTAPFR